MSKFVQDITMDPLEFQGDTVTAKLKPIPRGLYVQAMPLVVQMQRARGALQERLSREPTPTEIGSDPEVLSAMTKAVDVMAPHAKDYVSGFDGLKDAAGAPVTLETVFAAGFFFQVALHVTMQLVNTANVKEEDTGKSAGPSSA